MTEVNVSVLFARSDSIYRELNCDVWDAARDARLFCGLNPVIAHPPCRAWGQLAHLARPRRGERALALIALDWVRRNGGILEHPLRSKLFSQVIGYPLPSEPDAFGGWTLPYDQFWAGHLAQKATRFYLVGIQPKQLPALPFALGQAPCTVSGGQRAQLERGIPVRKTITKAQREQTPPEMAHWLVKVASSIR